MSLQCAAQGGTLVLVHGKALRNKAAPEPLGLSAQQEGFGATGDLLVKGCQTIMESLLCDST